MSIQRANRLRLTVVRLLVKLFLLGLGGCVLRPDGTWLLPPPAVEVVDGGDVQVGIVVRASEFAFLGENLEATLTVIEPDGNSYTTMRFPAAGDPPGWVAGPIQIAAGSIELIVTVYSPLGVFSTEPTTLQIFP